MKKVLSIILTLFLLFALTGCNGTAGENGSTVETVIVDETIKAHADPQIATGSGTLPELSAEDIAVKTEIAKYSDTKVDFRYNKQEVIQGKTYSISFSKIDYATNYECVLYTNKLGDEFTYNTKTGKLKSVVINSMMSQKTLESITKEVAEKLAIEYASTKCELEKYTMDFYKEIETGYYFCYTRYIGGYPSFDRFAIQIGYNGEIVFFNDTTDVYNGKNINFTKEFIDLKIKENFTEEQLSNLSSITINLNANNEVSVICTLNYIDEQGENCGGVNVEISLEK